MEIPKEHQLKCNGCGKILDMRDTYKSNGYTFRHLGKVYTLYGAERTLAQMKSQLKTK